ncbi:MAG: ribosomal L7Ae/L30e/S12e/Gadd45 family protein [Oscillospiraceae bacterium]|nr:ribosomal L7Ae/L30e/S12e/Gadd45 family protein [Oscillospiraceae bacterium]
MPGTLKESAKVIGAKQSRRAIAEGRAARVFLAEDADPNLTAPLRTLAESMDVPVSSVASMQALGKACGILVGSAAAVLIKDPPA